MKYRPYQLDGDPIIEALRAEGEADPDVVGVALTGSRALGMVTDESDYDAAFIVTDAAMARYEQAGHPARGQELTTHADLWHEALSGLRPDHLPAWAFQQWSDARVIYDRTGETTAAIDALRRIPEPQASETIPGLYDAYLNGLYRSLKSWRRGDELGGRLGAADSVELLLGLLFALERRWRPFSSRLWVHLDRLDGQGWRPGEVRDILFDLLSTGDPRRQQAVARRVEALLRTRGYGKVYDDWEGEIDQVLAWEFA